MKIMYKICVVALVSLITMGTTDANAQKRRSKPAKVKVLTEAEEAHIARMEEMRYSTQKIVFIDSLVVDKEKMLAAIGLPSEVGKIGYANELFRPEIGQGGAFINEMGDKCCLAAKNAKGIKKLYSSFFLDGTWTAPQPLRGLEQLGDSAVFDYPFVMADGVTVYFSAVSDEGIGGYDIYVTRFNASDNSFFNPENVGMPFNSEANDFFYIVDEFDNIGWFATDRRQPEGKVCIYTFIPTEVRERYDDIDDAKLSRLASLHSISDTWGDGKQRQAALSRLQAAHDRNAVSGDDIAADSFSFVVNDNTVYTSPSQFKAKDNASRIAQLTAKQKHQAEMCKLLETNRLRYASASASQKSQMRSAILQAERDIETIEKEIHQLTKEIRYAENKEIFR